MWVAVRRQAELAAPPAEDIGLDRRGGAGGRPGRCWARGAPGTTGQDRALEVEPGCPVVLAQRGERVLGLCLRSLPPDGLVHRGGELGEPGLADRHQVYPS
jgi:hypothetical protein